MTVMGSGASDWDIEEILNLIFVTRSKFLNLLCKANIKVISPNLKPRLRTE